MTSVQPTAGATMLTDDLYAHADARPDHEAVVYGEERLTWADLAERVDRLAHGLTATGIGAGDPVALLLPNAPAFVTSFLAVTALGGVAVPINPLFKQDELEFSFRNSGVRAVIGDEAGTDAAAPIVEAWGGVRQITTGPTRAGALAFERLIADHSGPRLPSRAPEEDFVFQFSSGSTGRPKRVARTHGQCWAEADSYVIAMEITPDDRIFCAIPLFHTYGMGNCLTTFVRAGSTLVIMEEPNPFVLHRERAVKLLEGERVTIFPGVPFNFRLLADLESSPDLSSLRLCYSAGSALPRSAFDAFLDRYGVAVRQLYGSTETGVMTMNVDPDPVATAASVGTPGAGLRVKVVDDDGATLPPGQEGEIAVSGPAIARGYADADEQSRAAFHDGHYFTGDLGRVDDEGRVFITGRKKLFIEVAGHKVDPVEVEDVLVEHPKVQEAVVVGVRGRAEGEEIVKAAIVAADGCEQRELITYCRERLANYKVPQIVEFREEIPKSPLGKILRKYLIE
jgi:long-chain acyl-CoA synthetase